MQEIADWFLANGFVRDDVASYIRYCISWSTRSGYDFTELEFQNDPKSTRPTDWEAIVGHHASGTNPRMGIGTCRNLAEIQQVFETLRTINGYEK